MIYMEDVQAITGIILEYIANDLAINDLAMSSEEEDDLFEYLSNMVEKLAGYPDYRNYN